MSNTPRGSSRVLIVGDVKAMRLLIRSLLVNWGIEHIIEAADGEAALEILRLTPTDLVIADLLMTSTDGLEMTRHLRRRQSSLNPAVPILMISGKMDAATIKAGIDAGVTDFLVKPISPAALQQRVKTLLEKPRPVVKSGEYYGPDRRRRQVGVPADRRGRSAEKEDLFEL